MTVVVSEQVGAARSFEPGAVRLLPGRALDAQRLNAKYLLSLDPERLLRNFRLQAGLPATAEPLGGWESPECGLRGHFVGHYLSACARGYAATRDVALRERCESIVSGLRECQRATGTGYLSAFPETELDVIETRFEGAWAPYYTLHKILAGLIDAHRLADIADALRAATELADYIGRRVERLSAEQIQAMCRTDLKPNPTNEFGGISESLQLLGEITSDSRYVQLAEVFDREWFIQPLGRQEDRLAGLHANTHIPMALALARRYERTGEMHLRNAVRYFWERTALARSYVNGGSTGPRPDGTEKSKGAEHWPAAFQLAHTLTPKINESCVTHNMLRLTDALFRWTGEDLYADFHERAYLNHVLCMQHPAAMGRYLYDHPLAPQSAKKYGEPLASFWCCYGTSVEAFAGLAQGIYYHSADTLWVNQFVDSEVTWREQGARIEQQTQFGHEANVRLVVRCGAPASFTMRVRVPRWTNGMAAKLNGALVPAGADAGYLAIQRTWSDADVLEVSFAMSVTTVAMPDDPGMFAFQYGPFVLAAIGDRDLTIRASRASAAASAVRPVARLAFETTLADGTTVPLVPLQQITDETFGVYFRLIQP